MCFWGYVCCGASSPFSKTILPAAAASHSVYLLQLTCRSACRTCVSSICGDRSPHFCRSIVCQVHTDIKCVTFLVCCSYQQSVSQHISDEEFATIKSFRVPGRVLFIRSSKETRHQARVLLPCCAPTQRPSLPLAPALCIAFFCISAAPCALSHIFQNAETC
jgi:hypothetical protein